ncbi:MAG: hypothetical protein HYV75_09910 [Opitutae bacterium]|nr:hypothetical protein [Opitutae bacterium]
MVLDQERRKVSGGPEKLAAAIRRGADLRIYTEFRHNEHIDTKSANHEIIQEVADFRTTYLVEDRWVAGIMTLRQPIELPNGFGPRPSMSFFMYNQDGLQAIARPYLDGARAEAEPGASAPDDHSDMPKYHQYDAWDAGTNAPSSNFVYDMGTFRYLVSDTWREVLACDADGTIRSGSVELLAEAAAQGCEVKVGLRGLASELAGGATAMDHEVFVHCGPCYYYTETKSFMVGTHPFVRVAPAIPMRYRSRGWDFGWLMPRSDGHIALWIVDPYTLKFRRAQARLPIRWFVR